MHFLSSFKVLIFNSFSLLQAKQKNTAGFYVFILEEIYNGCLPIVHNLSQFVPSTYKHLVPLSEHNVLKLGKVQQRATAEDRDKENVPLKKI